MKNIFFFLFFPAFLLLTCSSDETKEDLKKEGSVKSVFKDKNLVTFGNSITAAENSWAYQAYSRLQFGNLYNGAVGGAIWSKRERRNSNGNTIRTQNYNDPDFAGISNSNTANPDDLEYQKRINNCAIVHIQKYLSEKKSLTPDFIILSYGTNDLSSVAVMGNAELALQETNLDNLDLYTMAGAIKWSIGTLQVKFPKAKLYISFPIQAKSDGKNTDNLKKIEVIRTICEGMSVPYFNCYAECEITQENQERFLRDGLHPNEAGKVVHGTYIIKKLKEANKE